MVSRSWIARWQRVACLVGLPIATGCTELSAEEVGQLAAMELRASMVPGSPTNRVSDAAAAADLGQHLFFDARMSADGTVACASCHRPDQGWSDDRAVSLGVHERPGVRHSMPIGAAAMQRFLLWDGRADSLWSQALLAIENPDEMDFSRVEVVRLLASNYAQPYEEVFGPLPDIDVLPARGRPGVADWQQLSEAQRIAVDDAFANVGKALEAFERTVTCHDTRFDRWVRGEEEMTRAEEVGAAHFLRDGCVACHSGPAFSDGKFHNIGIGSGVDEPDFGREAGTELIGDNPFNGAGLYSDDPQAGAGKLSQMLRERGTRGAFRTPTLRGVGQRERLGHRGHIRGLHDFIDDIYDDPSLHGSAVGELDPLMREVDAERERRMVDFLRMLDCPADPRDFPEVP